MIGIALTSLALAIQAEAGASPALTPDGEPGCTLETHAVCLLPGRIGSDEAEAHLAGTSETYWIEDGILHVVARRPDAGARLCCAVQTPLETIGDDGLQGMSYSLARFDEAFLDIYPLPPADGSPEWPDRPVYRGPDALPPVPHTDQITGTVTNTEYDSTALGAPRAVTYYQPPTRLDGAPLPVVFVADGGNVNTLAPIAEALMAHCHARPVVMIGLWTESPTGTPQNIADDPRSRDYLWGVDEAGFLAHQRFLTDELVPFSQREFGASDQAQDRMLYGASSGAAWAISTALLHPDLFATAAAASLGWPEALDAAATIDPSLTFYISAGLYEAGFHHDSRNATARLREAGASATFNEFVSGHSALAFEQQFAHALSATFPAEEGCVPRITE